MSTPFASPAAQAASASLPVFPRPSAADFDAPGACMPLAQFGVIDVAGDDAATFLHSQLTNDIEHLDAASARLSGYCSPKGRLLASFLFHVEATDPLAFAAASVALLVIGAAAAFVPARRAGTVDPALALREQ